MEVWKIVVEMSEDGKRAEKLGCSMVSQLLTSFVDGGKLFKINF